MSTKTTPEIDYFTTSPYTGQQVAVYKKYPYSISGAERIPKVIHVNGCDLPEFQVKNQIVRKYLRIK